jgi:hypothetical protein
MKALLENAAGDPGTHYRHAKLDPHHRSRPTTVPSSLHQSNIVGCVFAFNFGADVGRTCLGDNHCGRDNCARRNDCMTHACLVVHEKCQENDDRQRNAEQPQQCTSSKAHGSLLICPLNVSPRHRYAFPELQDHQQDDETDRDAQQPK